jgi:hypothetical protein
VDRRELREGYGVDLKVGDASCAMEIDTGPLAAKLARVADAIDELNAAFDDLPPMVRPLVEQRLREAIAAEGRTDGGH